MPRIYDRGNPTGGQDFGRAYGRGYLSERDRADQLRKEAREEARVDEALAMERAVQAREEARIEEALAMERADAAAFMRLASMEAQGPQGPQGPQVGPPQPSYSTAAQPQVGPPAPEGGAEMDPGIQQWGQRVQEIAKTMKLSPRGAQMFYQAVRERKAQEIHEQRVAEFEEDAGRLVGLDVAAFDPASPSGQVAQQNSQRVEQIRQMVAIGQMTPAQGTRELRYIREENARASREQRLRTAMVMDAEKRYTDAVQSGNRQKIEEAAHLISMAESGGLDWDSYESMAGGSTGPRQQDVIKLAEMILQNQPDLTFDQAWEKAQAAASGQVAPQPGPFPAAPQQPTQQWDNKPLTSWDELEIPKASAIASDRLSDGKIRMAYNRLKEAFPWSDDEELREILRAYLAEQGYEEAK